MRSDTPQSDGVAIVMTSKFKLACRYSTAHDLNPEQTFSKRVANRIIHFRHSRSTAVNSSTYFLLLTTSFRAIPRFLSLHKKTSFIY